MCQLSGSVPVLREVCQVLERCQLNERCDAHGRSIQELREV